MTPDHAKSFRVIATLPALTGAAQANETTRQPALKGTITQSIAQLREAEEDYQRGLQAADGIGVTRDYFAAARYYRKAAEKGPDALAKQMTPAQLAQARQMVAQKRKSLQVKEGNKS